MSNPVITHQPANLTATVSGDGNVNEIQEILSEKNQMIPIGPFDKDVTIMDAVNFNLIGTYSHYFGTIKKWLLNTELETGHGTIQSGSDVMKNVAGYDLTRILIGAQGSLGKIKFAVFKLYPVSQKIKSFISTEMRLSETIEFSKTNQCSGLQIITRNKSVTLNVNSEKIPGQEFREVGLQENTNFQYGIRIVLLPSEVESFLLKVEKYLSDFRIFPKLGMVDIVIHDQLNTEMIFENLKNSQYNIFRFQNGKPIPQVCEHIEYIQSMKQIFDPKNRYPIYNTCR